MLKLSSLLIQLEFFFVIASVETSISVALVQASLVRGFLFVVLATVGRLVIILAFVSPVVVVFGDVWL